MTGTKNQQRQSRRRHDRARRGAFIPPQPTNRGEALAVYNRVEHRPCAPRQKRES